MYKIFKSKVYKIILYYKVYKSTFILTELHKKNKPYQEKNLLFLQFLNKIIEYWFHPFQITIHTIIFFTNILIKKYNFFSKYYKKLKF